MKKQKMSLEKMKSVLSNVLSREQMKEVMAGSGGGTFCGFNCPGGLPGEWPESCYTTSNGCRCSSGSCWG